ncbi:MAG TPA: AbrB/MazE/SpoVT family DNA-binding domain-containing protein [Tepidisphaeraceae bacterium]|jgi:AbrB family looped-hinge helix DNA binding protein|nr:AbrB/MazE/SpoVT family DNA-binding domain-containing protein [Tepidisphaeraceae bacterium]
MAEIMADRIFEMSQSLRTTLRVAEGGRIVIPAEVREQLEMGVGEDVVLTVEGDHVTLMNAKMARKRARERFRKYVSSDADLAKELMAERKVEARRE